eukprot:2747290-Amphidinium_carterae.1
MMNKYSGFATKIYVTADSPGPLELLSGSSCSDILAWVMRTVGLYAGDHIVLIPWCANGGHKTPEKVPAQSHEDLQSQCNRRCHKRPLISNCSVKGGANGVTMCLLEVSTRSSSNGRRSGFGEACGCKFPEPSWNGHATHA